MIGLLNKKLKLIINKDLNCYTVFFLRFLRPSVYSTYDKALLLVLLQFLIFRLVSPVGANINAETVQEDAGNTTQYKDRNDYAHKPFERNFLRSP